MSFQSTERAAPTAAISVRLPGSLLERIDADVRKWNSSHPKSTENRSERVIYLLEYAYQAGALNQFIDLMREQYLKILTLTPEQVALGSSTFVQVESLHGRMESIEEKLSDILMMVAKLGRK